MSPLALTKFLEEHPFMKFFPAALWEMKSSTRTLYHDLASYWTAWYTLNVCVGGGPYEHMHYRNGDKDTKQYALCLVLALSSEPRT